MDADAIPTRNIDSNGHYLGPSKLCAMFDLHSQTLRNWANQGLLPFIKTPGGNYLYEYGALSTLLGRNAKPIYTDTFTKKEEIIYARVSSAKQAGDLERQKELLCQKYPNHQLVFDIGSGLNWKRKGFRRLMDKVLSGEVGEIVVTRRDRLCRFGLELLEFIFKRFKTKFLVLGSEFQTPDADGGHDVQAELAEDLLAIVTVFVAKTNGMRSAAQTRQREADGEKNIRKGGRPRKKARIETKLSDESKALLIAPECDGKAFTTSLD